MVRILLAICRLTLRIFFRRVDVSGREHLPRSGKLMFALNHPNGLVDPLFVLCFSGRPVSFLAKEPLFRMPVVGYFVRSFRCLPVYRQQDRADPRKNRDMVRQAVALLASGQALAIFPEGTSHSDPRLRPLKSGAVRIAMSAAALSGDVVQVVPVGLYYSRKQGFRSNALIAFGEPLEVGPPGPGEGPSLASAEARVRDDAGSSPGDETGPVRALTAELAARIGELTLQAEDADVIYLAKTAERILAAAERDAGAPGPAGMAQRLELRQRLIAGHAALAHRPEVVALVERIRAHEASLEALGLRVDQRLALRPARVLAGALRLALGLLLLAAPGLVGLVTHYPTYRLVGWLSFRYSRSEADVVATVKVLGGLLFFPLTWLMIAGLAQLGGGLELGLSALALAPLTGYAALVWTELAATLARRARALGLLLTRRSFVAHVTAERREIRAEALRLGALI